MNFHISDEEIDADTQVIELGGEIDHYGATAEFVETTLGMVTWTGTGSHVVRVVSSSSRGTSKNLAIDAFVLVSK